MTSINPLTQLRTVPFGKVTRSAWVMIIGAGVNRLAAFLQIFLVLFLTDRGLHAVTAGLMLTSYGVGAIVGVLAGGMLADRIGPRSSVMASMLVTAATVAALPQVHAIPALMLLCLAAGGSAQMFRPAASVVIAAEVAPSDVVAVMGIYRLSINVASAIGPLLGGVAYHYSHASIFYFDAATSLCFCLVAMALPKRDAKPRGGDVPSPPATLARRSSPLADGHFSLVVLAQFLTSLVEVQYMTVLPLQLHDRGWDPRTYTVVLALNGVVVICCELLVIGLVSSVGLRTKVAVGSGLIGIGLAMFGIDAGIILILVATATWTLGEMLSAPGINAYPALISPPGTSGRYFGALSAGQTGGYAAGPVLGALVYQHAGSVIWAVCGLGGLLAWLGMRIGMRPVGRPTEPAAELIPEQAR